MIILIAEDEPYSSLFLARAVEKLHHSVLLARDGLEAWTLFRENDVDVVISDRVMPEIDGLELCRRIRQHPKDNYTYFIFVTALSDRESFQTGLDAGADDYLSKPLILSDLRARLVVAERVTRLHRELIEQKKQLEQLNEALFAQARRDPLTKVGNRLSMLEDLESAVSLVARYKHQYGIALVDVDHFKRYNDHYGHLAGDEILCRVAALFSQELRADDRVYRFGGEEFMLLLHGLTVEDARNTVERIRKKLECQRIPHEGLGPSGIVTVSSGVASLRSEDPLTVDDALNRADDALYCAKRRGRNRVEASGKAEASAA